MHGVWQRDSLQAKCNRKLNIIGLLSIALHTFLRYYSIFHVRANFESHPTSLAICYTVWSVFWVPNIQLFEWEAFAAIKSYSSMHVTWLLLRVRKMQFAAASNYSDFSSISCMLYQHMCKIRHILMANGNVATDIFSATNKQFSS